MFQINLSLNACKKFNFRSKPHKISEENSQNDKNNIYIYVNFMT
jgi:hypothetical protein